jgi:hypothetical protein
MQIDDNDFGETVRQAVALFDARDPERARFGARRHRYRFRAPLAPARLDALDRDAAVRFPDELRSFVTTVADGGAGPYHGLLPLDHPVQRSLARGAFDPADPYRGGVIGLGHLGCGYMALYVVDRAHAAYGQVWIDARDAGVPVRAAYPSFRHYVTDWIARLAHAEWLPSFVPEGACALPHALSAYFRAVEEERGMAEGTLAGEELREALERIPDGGIATAHAGRTPFFDDGDRVDLCVACERLAENLGLRRSTIVEGVEAIPGRIAT